VKRIALVSVLAAGRPRQPRSLATRARGARSDDLPGRRRRPDADRRLPGHLRLPHGQQFTTLMHENPGRFVQVRVSVDPVGR